MMPTRGHRGAALVLVLCAAAGASAQDLSPFGDPDERQELLEPPLPLPESTNGTVRSGSDPVKVARIERLGQVFQAIRACWRLPAGSGFSGQEVTVRLAFRRDGTVLGEPRITFYKPGTEKDWREGFVNSVRTAFEQCTPLPFSDRFGAANAGRPFTFRFIDARPL